MPAATPWDDPAQVGHLDLAFHGDQGEKGRPEGNEHVRPHPRLLAFVLSLEAMMAPRMTAAKRRTVTRTR